MHVSSEQVSNELDELERVTSRLDSVTSVLGSESEPLEKRVDIVKWRPEEVTMFPADLLSNRPALRVQLLQAAHFLFHRLCALKCYELPYFKGVVVKWVRSTFLQLSNFSLVVVRRMYRVETRTFMFVSTSISSREQRSYAGPSTYAISGLKATLRTLIPSG